MNIDNRSIEIITGRYGVGSDEQNKIVDTIFGEDVAKERFELYFHWYNIMHELGHGLISFNASNRKHPVEEEQLVNDFAVAYWHHYGEEDKIRELHSLVEYALSTVTCPAPDGMDHKAYATSNWGKQELFNFNNYGWFQFNCVLESLQTHRTLEPVLMEMGVTNIRVQQKNLLKYSLESDMASSVVMDAAPILRQWGAVIPKIVVTYDNDPNRHMCKIIDAQ